jgi:DNA-binding NtrC family response regulator
MDLNGVPARADTPQSVGEGRNSTILPRASASFRQGSGVSLANRTATSARVRTVNYPKSLLVVLEGPDTGLCFESAGDPVRIGTAADNDLILSDATVSAHHCELMPRPQGLEVYDRMSEAGTFWGAVRINRVLFSEDFQLRLGATLISVKTLRDGVTREQVVDDRFVDVLGVSDCMHDLFAKLVRTANTDDDVLIEGETGTGKSLIAESIHRASKRACGPYVVLDCATPLVESLLFGQDGDVFSDSTVPFQQGVFELAHGGTLFLDGLDELPFELHSKLLRVLVNGEVSRLGSRESVRVDVRVIAATNPNLRAAVERGHFGEDVYFRLAATTVYVPPLRDRLDDLPLLVEHFLSDSVPSRSIKDVPSHIWDIFEGHSWPGNVRELKEAVAWFILPPEDLLLEETAPSTVSPSSGVLVRSEETQPLEPLPLARRRAVEAFERSYLEHLLSFTRGSLSKSAIIAGVSRQMIHRMLRKHRIQPKDSRR